MNSRVQDLFHEVADLPPEARARYFHEQGVDEETRKQVEKLLAFDSGASAFLMRDIGFAAEQAISQLHAQGWRCGPYRLLELIGRGGMGAVYLAERADGEVRQRVAVKLLQPGADDPQHRERFLQERQILATLSHPNVARLLDAGHREEDGQPFLVMEHVEGKPIDAFAAGLSIRQKIALFRKVCAAVSYLHRNLIVHRDLKPSNILVTAEGEPKLLDFGIAKILDLATDSTMTVMRMLTPDYASPEQVMGRTISTASDIYSLGAVLHRLLAGKPPHEFDQATPQDIVSVICEREITRPSRRAPELKGDLDVILMKALQKEPQERYGTVEQFAEDLESFLESRPIRARKGEFVYRARKFARRYWVPVVAAALALIGVVAGVVAVNRQARRAEYRFQQVRKLANTVLFDLNPEIENLAGSTKARELLVKTSLNYLDSLAAEARDDPALQLDLATAYEKIGDVQGNNSFSNLGHPDAALESYGKAVAIARKLAASRTALEVWARSYSKMGGMQYWELGRSSEGHENLRLAVGIADSIPAKTGEPAYRVRAEAYGLLGEIDSFAAPSWEQASEPFRRSLEIAREWVRAEPSTESLYFLTVALERWGDVLTETGDLPQALENLLGALRVIEQLLKEQPENAVWDRERGMCWGRIGVVSGHPQYLNLGEYKTAAGWFQRKVDNRERLLAADPNNSRARFDVSEATGELAAAHRESDPRRAERLYRRSLALGSSYLSSNPHNTEALNVQAANRVGFAWVLRRLGKRSEALLEMRRAVEIQEGLAKQDAGSVGFRQHLGVALHTLAAHQLEMGDAAGAERELQRSVGILEPLSHEQPRNLTLLRDLADCYQVFGDLAASRSDWKQAQSWYQKSLDLWERWKQVGVSSVYDRQRRDLAARLVAQAAKRP